MTILLIKTIKLLMVLGFAKISTEIFFTRHAKRYREIVDLFLLLASLYLVEFILDFSFSTALQVLKPAVAVFIVLKLYQLFYTET